MWRADIIWHITSAALTTDISLFFSNVCPDHILNNPQIKIKNKTYLTYPKF